jgi:hypothetical protein
MIKWNAGSMRKLSEFYTTETSVLYCWGCELIHSPIWMWLTPQSYIWCSFGCRFSGCRGQPHSIVLEILQLKLTATVVIVGPQVVHHFLVSSIWLVSLVTHILVELVFWYVINVVSKIDVVFCLPKYINNKINHSQ